MPIVQIRVQCKEQVVGISPADDGSTNSGMKSAMDLVNFQ